MVVSQRQYVVKNVLLAILSMRLTLVADWKGCDKTLGAKYYHTTPYTQFVSGPNNY